MRYSRTESTYILGAFDSGDTVTIDIYDLDTSTKVVDGESCEEVGTTGIFKYNFSQVITGKKEYLWIMTNGDYTRVGKVVLGGWLDDVKERVESYLDESVSSRASATQLSQHDTDIKAELSNIEGAGFDPATDSLEMVRDKLDEVDANLSTHDADIKSELSRMEGTGFDETTDSLEKIRDKLDEVDTSLATHDTDIKSELSRIEGAGFDETTDTLEKIRDKLDEIDSEAEDIRDDLRKHDKKITGLFFS